MGKDIAPKKFSTFGYVDASQHLARVESIAQYGLDGRRQLQFAQIDTSSEGSVPDEFQSFWQVYQIEVGTEAEGMVADFF